MAIYDFTHCRLCPRSCMADRLSENSGSYCGMPETILLARAALHDWEEPLVSDSAASGAVFFSGCSLHCVYCQNRPISVGKKGYPVSVGRLAAIFLELQGQGAQNIDLVTPTHYVPQIIEAIQIARAHGLHLPILYNTSGYESVETLRMLDGYVDIYLPDFKYMDARLSAKYSDAPDYFTVACTALAEMVRQVPQAVYDKDRMLRGVIVRHLLLPGCLMDAKHIIRYLYMTYRDDICISLLNQYTPVNLPEAYPELNHRVKRSSYEKLVQYALDLGVTNAYIQEYTAANEEFIPAFNGEGVYGQGGLSGKA